MLAKQSRQSKEVDGVMFICADHGNAEQLVDEAGEPFTAHTTNPVPFYIGLIMIQAIHSKKEDVYAISFQL